MRFSSLARNFLLEKEKPTTKKQNPFDLLDLSNCCVRSTVPTLDQDGTFVCHYLFVRFVVRPPTPAIEANS